MLKLSELTNIAYLIRGYNREYLDKILDGLKKFLVFNGLNIDKPRIISEHKVVSANAESIDKIIEILSEQIKAKKTDSLLLLCHGENIVKLGEKIISLTKDKSISVEELLGRLKEKESLPKDVIFANCSQLNLAEQQKISKLYPDINIVFIGSDRVNFSINIDCKEIAKYQSISEILQASCDNFCKIRVWRKRALIASQSKELNVFGFLSMYLAEEQDKLRKAQLNRLLDCSEKFKLMMEFLQNPSKMPKIYPALFDDVTDINELYCKKHNLEEVNFDLEKVATTLAGLYYKSLDGKAINISKIKIDEIAKKLEVSPKILLAKANSIIASKLALDLKPLAIALDKIDMLDKIYKTKFLQLEPNGFLDVEATLKLSKDLNSLYISSADYDVATEKYQNYKTVFHRTRLQLNTLENKDLANFLKSICENKSLLLPDKKRIIFEIVSKEIELLQDCPDDIKEHLAYDYDFLTALCKVKGCALKYACDDFKNDKALVFLALKNDFRAYRFIGETLRTTTNVFPEVSKLIAGHHPASWLYCQGYIKSFFKPQKAQDAKAVGDEQGKATGR